MFAFFRRVFSRHFKYFVDGLLLILPFALTGTCLLFVKNKAVELVSNVVVFFGGSKLESSQDSLFFFGGIVLVFWLVGYLGSSLGVRFLISALDRLMLQIPLVSTVYSYLKEYADGFMEKLDKPVRVVINKELGIERIGFITESNLKNIGISDKVAVYIPHASLTFTGEVHIIPEKQVVKIDASRTMVLKFLLSGGISGLKESA